MRSLVTLVLFFSLLTPLAAAPDVSKLTLAPGFKISVLVDGLDAPRSLAVSPSGTVFVGTRTNRKRETIGKVYAFQLRAGNTSAGEVVTVAQGLNVPNGVAFRNGDLYVAEIDRVLKYADIEKRLANPPNPETVYDDLPSDFHHGWKFIRFSPDGKLYVPVGAPCNICEEDEDEYYNIQRMNADGSDAEVYAFGVRNTVGFDWHPNTGDLWFTDNGRDLLGDMLPADELNHAPLKNMHFGFPYCHQGDFPDPEFGNSTDKHCREFTAPAAKLGPHVAALGMRFYTGDMFPENYHNQPFIALHGSWNRTKEAGHTGAKIIVPRLRNNLVREVEVIAEGWLQDDNTYIGRPVDVAMLDDGSMLISDDFAGVIYRLWYEADVESAVTEALQGVREPLISVPMPSTEGNVRPGKI